MQPTLAHYLASTYLVYYQALRGQLLEVLTDADLGFRMGGDTLPLGELCREFGEVEHAYVESFRTFRCGFEWRHPDPGIATSVDALAAWYAALDRDLAAALDALTDADLERLIVREDVDVSDFPWVPTRQLDNYREALLLFYGKASIYLRAMGRPLPGDWPTWTG